LVVVVRRVPVGGCGVMSEVIRSIVASNSQNPNGSSSLSAFGVIVSLAGGQEQRASRA